MAISYPTSIDSFTNPSAGSPLDNPDHATQHSDLNDAVIQLQQKVGITNSSNTDSLDYKINNVSTDPVRISLSEANGGFVTGATVHTTPAGYTDTLYLSGSGVGNRLVTSSGSETFDPNVDSAVYSLAIQSDDKILLGGGFTSVGGTTRNRVARIHANGDLDTTFDPDASSTVRSAAIQSDGKIVIGGDFTTVGGTTRNRVARVHANGDLDTTFNPDASSTVRSVALQSDGKILLGGSFTSVGATTRNRVARVHANGDLDTTFNPNANNSVYSVAVQSDGKIVIGGSFTSVGATTRNRIARVHANGDLDTTFNPSANGTVYSVALQSDGKIVISGSFSSVGGASRYYIARLHANGDRDTTFDPNNAAADYDVYSTVEQSDGKIVIGGAFFTVGGGSRLNLARIHANGDLDATFNPDVTDAFEPVWSVAIQSDGNILFGGEFTAVGGAARNRIARVDYVVGAFNDLQSEVYVNPGTNSMDLLVSDYPLPAGYSVLSQISGTLTGYVTREAN